jgi:hypothetical protein
VEERDKPNFDANFELWKLILADEHHVHVDAFESPMHPSKFNKASCHIMVRVQAGLPPPPMGAISTPPMTPVPVGSSSSSGSATSHRAASAASAPPWA